MTAILLALLPVCFGLYQFQLSNEFKREDNQTRALLAALEGETPSEICGNLSLLAEGGLVTDERLIATEALIAKITKNDSEELDGGLNEFDCLPRITSQSSEVVSTRIVESQVSLAQRIASENECDFNEIELKYAAGHDREIVDKIEIFLKTEGIRFSETSVSASEKEREAYSGLIWYYYPEARRCAQSILDGLNAQEIDLQLRYYTRKGLPSNLPIRIWPSI